MNDQTRLDAIHRLKSIAGHVNGIVRMLEEDRYCIDVIKQVQAIQNALDKVSDEILDSHLKSCVLSVMQDGDKTDRERVMNEIAEVFRHSGRS